MRPVSTRGATRPRPKPSVDRLIRARAEAALTQEELATATGISHSSIGKYERGERSPMGPHLRRIAEATGKPVAWFFETDVEEAVA